MGLGDNFSDAALLILEGVKSYNQYSFDYRDEIIDSLTIIYHNIFKIDSAGLPSSIPRNIHYCKKYATKHFNSSYYELDDDCYAHCEDCLCHECVNRTKHVKYDCSACSKDEGWNCECFLCIEKLK